VPLPCPIERGTQGNDSHSWTARSTTTPDRSAWSGVVLAAHHAEAVGSESTVDIAATTVFKIDHPDLMRHRLSAVYGQRMDEQALVKATLDDATQSRVSRDSYACTRH
jgi:hypothetical protein